MDNKPHYYVRFIKSFDTVYEAKNYERQLPHKTSIELGYHIPQPEYKTWVPKFIIKLITK